MTDKDHTAEVLTPAEVVVWAACPLCDIAQPIILQIEPQLTVDSDGRSLKLQSKAKAVTHLCGQLTLTVVDGQAELPLSAEQAAEDDGIDEALAQNGQPFEGAIAPTRVHELLALAAEKVPLDTVRKWAEGDLVQAASYAEAVLAKANGQDVDIPHRPAVLGPLSGFPASA